QNDLCFWRNGSAAVSGDGLREEREEQSVRQGIGCRCRTEQAIAQGIRSLTMGKAFESIARGLEEAIAHAQGQETGAIVHRLDVPEVDVAAIRARTGLSQAAFARSIGVAKGTLLNWEQGRRRPTGPAKVLLAMIARKPAV